MNPRSMDGLVTLFALAAASCVDTAGPGPDGRPWQLDLYASSYDVQSDLGVSCRMVQVLFDEHPPLAPPWTSSVTVLMERQAGSASAPVTRAEAVTLEFALDSLAPDSVRLVVSGPYSATVEGSPMPFAGYYGTWTCDDSFPFADDEDLLAAGLDPTEPMRGVWTLGPMPLEY